MFPDAKVLTRILFINDDIVLLLFLEKVFKWVKISIFITSASELSLLVSYSSSISNLSELFASFV